MCGEWICAQLSRLLLMDVDLANTNQGNIETWGFMGLRMCYQLATTEPQTRRCLLYFITCFGSLSRFKRWINFNWNTMMLDLQLVYRCNVTFKALHQNNIFYHQFNSHTPQNHSWSWNHYKKHPKKLVFLEVATTFRGNHQRFTVQTSSCPSSTVSGVRCFEDYPRKKLLRPSTIWWAYYCLKWV